MAIHANSTRTPERRLLRGGDAPGRLLSTDEMIRLLGGRQNAEAVVEALIAEFDRVDGDPDIEPRSDEDLSIDDQPHDQEPDEPSLGSLDRRTNQVRWAGDGRWGDNQDRELDRSDHERTAPERHGMGFVACGPDDAEPSFGSCNPGIKLTQLVPTGRRDVLYLGNADQRRWADGGSDDDREMGDDNGIGDEGGAAEQWFPGVE